jgi:hypothetical protein
VRIKHHLICIFTLFLLCSSTALSEVLHWPEICRTGTLVMKNFDSAGTSLWLQKFDPQLAAETELDVPAKGELSINIEKLENEHYSLLHFASPQKIAVSYKCGKNTYSSTGLEGGVITYPRSDSRYVWLQNLYSGDNTVEIEFQNLAFQKLGAEVLKLSALASRNFPLPESIRDWQYLKISSSNRLTSFPLNENGNVLPMLIQAQQTQVDSSAAYFLVAAREGVSDSFVVQIRDFAMAARARDLVKNPQKEKMLFAKVQKDHQGFNRNFSTEQKNLWSWSTTEVTNFSDFGSIACNGQPQVLEDRVDSWLADPGQICFWNYRVKKELTPLEVATGKLQ